MENLKQFHLNNDRLASLNHSQDYANYENIKNNILKTDNKIEDTIITTFYTAANDLINNLSKLKRGMTGQTKDVPNEIVDKAIKAGEFNVSGERENYNNMSHYLWQIESICAHNGTDYSNNGNYGDNGNTSSGGSGGTAAYSPRFGGNSSTTGCIHGSGYSNNCEYVNPSICNYQNSSGKSNTSFSSFDHN